MELDPQEIEDFRASPGATLTECEHTLRNLQSLRHDFTEDDFGSGSFESYRELMGMSKSGPFTRMAYSNALREFQQGTFTGFDQGDLDRIRGELGYIPFNFQRSETLYWLFRDVPYYEERVRTERRGGYGGVTFRLLNGVYYSAGNFQSRSVEESATEYVDRGLLGITDRHLYFAGSSERFRIRYDRVVAFDYYSDGIGVTKEAASARPQSFLMGDGWFAYNLVTELAQRQHRGVQSPVAKPTRAAAGPQVPDIDIEETREPSAAQGNVPPPPRSSSLDSELARTQRYVIYEDDPTNRARVHTVNCSHYLKRRTETLPDNRWHDSPITLQEADTLLRELNKRDSGYCGMCMRGVR